MAISVVLRLVEQALRAGRLAGEVEVVETGERRVVKDADELVRFLRPGAGGDAVRPAPVGRVDLRDETVPDTGSGRER